MSDYDRSDVNRLLAVLQHREADRVPYIEFEIASKAVYEYVLEHELEYDAASATHWPATHHPRGSCRICSAVGHGRGTL